jgi:hypothetical protein
LEKEMMMSDDNDAEIERQRLEELADLDEHAQSSDGFLAGGMGCHEALHAASMLVDDVGNHLISHPAIVRNPEWFKLAWEAHEKLYRLYQSIGAKHL